MDGECGIYKRNENVMQRLVETAQGKTTLVVAIAVGEIKTIKKTDRMGPEVVRTGFSWIDGMRYGVVL
jgi:hypothetical protein